MPDKKAGYQDLNMSDNFEEIIQGQISYARSLIAKRAWVPLENFLHAIDSHEIASIIEDLSNPTNKIMVFRLLSEALATEVFMNLDSDEQEKLIFAFTDSEAGAILAAMDPDDRTKLLGDLPPTVVKKLLKLLPLNERKIANTLLNYPEDSAGRIMTPEYVALTPNLTASEALTQIKAQSSQKETIYTSYVVDGEGVLIGLVSLEDLILAPDKKRIKDFMKDNPTSATTQTDQEEITRLIHYYELLVLPITDTNDRLVGIITSDDVVEIMQSEVTEDFQRFMGISPVEASYLSGSIWSLIVSRSGWVLMLLLMAGFSQDVILRYGEILQKFWFELSLFFTVIIGVAGNIGSQSSILVIRSIATHELTKQNTGELIGKSILSGLIMGIILASVLLLRIFVFGTGTTVMWVASLTMVFIVLISNVMGAILPLVLKKINIDPAIVSAPLISTIMDLGGLVLYLEIARYFLI